MCEIIHNIAVVQPSRVYILHRSNPIITFEAITTNNVSEQKCHCQYSRPFLKNFKGLAQR